MGPTPQILSLVQRPKRHQTGMKSPSAVLASSAGSFQLRGTVIPKKLLRGHLFSSSSSCLQEQPTEQCCWTLEKSPYDKLYMIVVPAAPVSDAL